MSRYRTRTDNSHAKAGNLNAALAGTGGELILVLDADHVPAEDILEHTVGHFLKDPRLFLVQTPHFFVNPDPLERNLGCFERMPSESEMFYGVIQAGLDFWNAAFFCGSAAVLRRSPLLEVGGIAGSSITEDAETALTLHARGYRSLYVDRPMVAGLAPETLSAFITQRIRWAQGMTQILLKNPLLTPGLGLAQRLCYLTSSLFWLFPFGHLAFLLTPLTTLLFGVKLVEASVEEFLAFASFHVVCSLAMSNLLFGRHRWPFVSDLYELLQSVFTLGALLSVVRHPRRPEFKVTPKTRSLFRDQLSPLATPFLVLFLVLVLATGVGVWRWFADPLGRDQLGVVLARNLVNLSLMLAAVGVTFERAGRQLQGAIPRALPARLVSAGGAVPVTLAETALDGGRIVLDRRLAADLVLGDGPLVLQLPLPGGMRSILVDVEGRRARRRRVELALRYRPQGSGDEATLVRLCYGDSAVWAGFQGRRQRRRSLVGGFAFLVGRGAARSAALLVHLLEPRRRAGRPVAEGRFAAGPAVAASLLIAPSAAADEAPAPPAQALIEHHRPTSAPHAERTLKRVMPLQAMLAGGSPLEFRGPRGQLEFALPLPAGAPVEDAVVRLVYAGAPELEPEHSKMVLYLNGRMVSTLPLAVGPDSVRAEVRLPAELLRPGGNVLALLARREHRDGCSAALTSGLWTWIDPANSYVVLNLRRPALPPRLSDLGAGGGFLLAPRDP